MTTSVPRASIVKHARIPPSRDYSVSGWPQPLIVIAMRFQIALYLGMYQLDIVSSVWEPFFGTGSQRALNTTISKALRVANALQDAFRCLLDTVTGVIGDTCHWRTKPWIVVLFGIARGPLDLLRVLLVILQPVIVGAWCMLCLATVGISIVMISSVTDKLLASLQYLLRASIEAYFARDVFYGKLTVTSNVQ